MASIRRPVVLIAIVAMVVAAWRLTAERSRDVADASPPSHVRRPRMLAAPDSASLLRASARASELPRLRSLLVSWKGDVILERYFHGASASTPANIKSASKTIISALVGIAVHRGDLRLSQTLGELLSVDARGLDTAKRSITVEDLLTMRAGLQSTSFENYGAWVSSGNWVRDALRRPMVAPHGAGAPMIYSTGSTHLLSAILTRVTKTNTHAYADRHLFRPLGIRLRAWTTDPQGVYFGGNEMRMTPREMLAFGALYMTGGVAPRGGDTVITRVWIDSSWAPRTESPWSGNSYGYGWWIRSTRGFTTYFAWGYGGQYIFVIPELQLVVVTTSDPAASRDGGHNSSILNMLDSEIVSAVAG
jgi:CubicO group peptidase (beta-lactamase class C family)